MEAEASVDVIAEPKPITEVAADETLDEVIAIDDLSQETEQDAVAEETSNDVSEIDDVAEIVTETNVAPTDQCSEAVDLLQYVVDEAAITETEDAPDPSETTINFEPDEIELKQDDTDEVRPPPSNALTDLMMDANITIVEEVIPADASFSIQQEEVVDEEDDLMNDLHLGQFDSEPTTQTEETVPTTHPPIEYDPEDDDEPAAQDLDSDLLQIASESAARSRTIIAPPSDSEPEEILDSSSAYSEEDDDDVDEEDDREPAPHKPAGAVCDPAATIEINDDDDDDDDDIPTTGGDPSFRRSRNSTFDDDDRSGSDGFSCSASDAYDDESSSPKPQRVKRGSGSSNMARPMPSDNLDKPLQRRPRTLREKLKKKSINILRRKMHVRVEQLHPVAAQFGPTVIKSAHLFDADFVSAKNVTPHKESQRPTERTPASKITAVPFVNKSPSPAHDDSSDEVEMIEDSTPEVSPVKQNGSQTNELSVSAPITMVDNIKIELVMPHTAPTDVDAGQLATKDVEVMDVDEKATADEVEAVEVKGEPPIAAASEPIAEVVNSSEPPTHEEEPAEVKQECEKPAVIEVDAQDKPTESSVPAVTAPQEDKEEDSEAYEVAKRARKRARSVSPDRADDEDAAQVPPSKRLCAELERSFGDHDKTLREYIDKTSNNSLDEVERHLDQLRVDIAHLDELSAAKELEWNNILHLKKCKEEIVLRLNRRKTVMEIMAGKMGDMPTGSEDTTVPTVDKRMARELKQSVVNHVGHDGATNSNHVMGSGMSMSQSILASRANMKSADLAKEKANTTRLHSILFSRNILPKPVTAAPPPSASPGHPILLSQPHSTSSSPILNNYITSGPALSLDHPMAAAGNVSNQLTAQHQLQKQLHHFQQHQQQRLQQQAINEILMNGVAVHHGQNAMGGGAQIGRQGPIKDVRSIIDDHRQKHPEQVPRRGRRRKGSPRPPNDEPSRPCPTANLTPNNLTMNDFFIEMAKVASERLHQSQSNAQSPRRQSIDMKNNTSTPIMKAALGYPEVTLHPVSAMQDSANAGAASTAHSNSLLHGILTKQNPRPQPGVVTTSGYTSYSPTLARLLTAPERIAPLIPGPLAGQSLSNINNNHNMNSYHSKSLQNLQSQMSAVAAAAAAGGGVVNLTSKPQSEITITPVIGNMASHSLQQTLLQSQVDAQQQRLHNRLDRGGSGGAGSYMRSKQDMVVLDDEADDDRLVIDEGADEQSSSQQQQQQHHLATVAAMVAVQNAQDFQENDVPECQGCKKREAQFVCAGCSNQWYCSRGCQVSAWDEHSDVCTG